jgi:hypothetical protein
MLLHANEALRVIVEFRLWIGPEMIHLMELPNPVSLVPSKHRKNRWVGFGSTCRELRWQKDPHTNSISTRLASRLV